MTPEERLLQIRRSHASARPTRVNFAWWNTHQDLSFVLAALEATQAELASAKADQARYKWLAPLILAPDYGDNDLPGQQVGWRVDNRYAGSRGVRNPVFVAGPSIDAAIASQQEKK